MLGKQEDKGLEKGPSSRWVGVCRVSGSRREWDADRNLCLEEVASCQADADAFPPEAHPCTALFAVNRNNLETIRGRGKLDHYGIFPGGVTAKLVSRHAGRETVELPAGPVQCFKIRMSPNMKYFMGSIGAVVNVFARSLMLIIFFCHFYPTRAIAILLTGFSAPGYPGLVPLPCRPGCGEDRPEDRGPGPGHPGHRGPEPHPGTRGEEANRGTGDQEPQAGGGPPQPPEDSRAPLRQGTAGHGELRGHRREHSGERAVRARTLGLHRRQAAAAGGLRACPPWHHRIDTIARNLPPLRERREDVETLANHFLQQICQEENKKILGFDDVGIELFRQYPWPGYVRELGNEVHGLVIQAEQNQIICRELPPRRYEARPGRPAGRRRAGWD